MQYVAKYTRLDGLGELQKSDVCDQREQHAVVASISGPDTSRSIAKRIICSSRTEVTHTVSASRDVGNVVGRVP